MNRKKSSDDENLGDSAQGLRKRSQKERRSTWGGSSPGDETEWDGNQAWQTLIGTLREISAYATVDEMQFYYSSVIELYARFTETVRNYTMVLVSEYYCPEDQKTIKPIEENSSMLLSSLVQSLADLSS